LLSDRELQGVLTHARESVAPSSREVDGANKGHRNQQNNGGDQGIDDHNTLLKFGKVKCKPDAKGTSYVFNELRFA
jgi:hypothetical protein